jgi:hypothetical protein
VTVRKAGTAKSEAHRDVWPTLALAAAVVAAREMVGDDGPIRSNSLVGRLGADEWGWIVSPAIAAWIRTRAEQAATEGWNEERAIRVTGLDPDPWFEGAIAAILPKLADTCPDLDWSKPIGSWSKDEIVGFLTVAITLTRRAVAARNVTEEQHAGRLESVDTLLDEICPFEKSHD